MTQRWKQVETGPNERWTKRNFTLVRAEKNGHVAWELRDPKDKLLLAQYELPGICTDAPLFWASQELAHLNYRSGDMTECS